MENNVVKFNDIKELKETRKKELEFYTKQLELLNNKLFFIQKEIQLTELIIKCIEDGTV